MKPFLGALLSMLVLTGCVTPPAAPRPAQAKPPVLIGTPTSEVTTSALEALQNSTRQDVQLLVHLTVEPDGSVSHPTATFSKLGQAETATVLTAIQQWHFKPARVHGQAVAREFIYPMFFGPDADRQRTVFMCRNEASIYEPARRCQIVNSGGWRIYRFDPVYPPALLDRRLAGSVTVGFDIGPDGRAVAPKVVVADPPGLFDAAAVEAVKAWYFERLDGTAPAQPESHQHVTVTVRFTPPSPSGSAGQ